MYLSQIRSEKISHLFQAHVFPALEQLFPEKPLHERGGWYYLGWNTDPPLCLTLVHGLLGAMNDARSATTYAFSEEKARRLAHHPNHMSSRESADAYREQYPGALRYNTNLIGSFSGYPAAMDEAIVAFIGVQQAFVDEETIWHRLGEDGQMSYQELLKTMNCFSSRFITS